MGIVEFELEYIVCVVIVYHFLHLLYPFHTLSPSLPFTVLTF